MSRSQGSSFDPELFDEVQEIITGSIDTGAPDLEAHILGEDSQTDEEQNVVNAQFCYEFVNHPMWPLYVKSLNAMVDREFKKFTSADRDPEDHLRRTWKAYATVVKEIIGNVESAAQMYQTTATK